MTGQCSYRIGDELNEPMQCGLADGHPYTHRTEGGYIFSTEQSLRYETELEHSQYVVDLRADLKATLKNAESDLLVAHTLVKRLASDQVHDVEFAEGNGYIERAITEAGLFVAAAQAMTDALLK